jgi:transposase
MHTQQNNRAHALGSSQALPALVLRERQRHQRYLEHRMKQLRREARRLIARDPELDRRYRLMLTVPGIGETSALPILGEWVVLSDRADARQWVAFSGLDPSVFTSGTSVEKRPPISRGEAAICVARYTCPRWWPCAASLTGGVFMNACSAAAKHVSRQS